MYIIPFKPLVNKGAVTLFVCSFIFFISCNTHQSPKTTVISLREISNTDVGKRLQVIITPFDTSVKKWSATANVKYTYQLNGYNTIWLTDDGKPLSDVETFLKELDDIRYDGIDPERYNLSALQKIYNEVKKEKSSADDIAAFDTAFTHSYLAASHDLLFGELLPKKVDSLWFHVNDSAWDVPQLLAKNDKKYKSLNEFRSALPTYALLRTEYKHYYTLMQDSQLNHAITQSQTMDKADSNAFSITEQIINTEAPWITTQPNDTISEKKQLLIAYQNYSGIKPTGKLDSTTIKHLAMPPSAIMDQLAANMERIRWMQQQVGNLYILVDVPLMELFFRKDGQNAMHMRVVVGKPIRQTPSLFANMANIVINPQWGVPPTILKKDVLPGIQKSKKYLAKKGLKAYDHNGNVISVNDINEKNYKRYSYRQAPGDDNSLGYVKFNLPNPWDIYLHDTPHRGDFANRYRALSSGCIRVQQPQQMALYILSELEKKRYDQDRLDSMIGTHKTRWEVLKNKIPVHIVYLTAFEDTTGSHIHLVSDIYNRDAKLIQALADNRTIK